MRRTAYRLTQHRYQESAYTGVGSLQRHGRWHRAGIPVVYAAESPAVALLEVLVHVERPRLITMELVVVRCDFDETLLETVADYIGPEGLPENWRGFPWPRSTQEIGQRWFEARRSVVLEVPSAVMPSAKNYLLNPEHPNFGEVTLDPPEPFDVDPRLGN